MPEILQYCLRCDAVVELHTEGDQVWLMCPKGCFICRADASDQDLARLMGRRPVRVDPLDEARLERARARFVEEVAATV